MNAGPVGDTSEGGAGGARRDIVSAGGAGGARLDEIAGHRGATPEGTIGAVAGHRGATPERAIDTADEEPDTIDGSESHDGYDAAPARGTDVGFAIFDTVLGACGIAWGTVGITGVQLPEESADEVRERMTAVQPGLPEAEPPESVRAAIGRIQALLAGGSDDDLADIPLDMSHLSGFLQRTYALTRTITPGHTLTYGQIAERLGSPGLARAVGRAMGANPFPIIVPCHRVLGADGSIGGFSAHGGALTKRRMLLAEGVAEQEGPALFGTEELYP